jgi:hypothetical protein
MVPHTLLIEHVFDTVGVMTSARRPSLQPQTSAGRAVARALTSLRSAIDELGSIDLAAMQTSELAAGVLDFQRALDRGTAVLASHLSAADAAQVWAGSGNKNVVGWLAEHSKIGYGHAAELTRLADAIDASSAFASRVKDGSLSTATAAALAPAVLARPDGTTDDDIHVLVECCTNSGPNEARAAAEMWKAAHETVSDDELTRRRFARRSVRFGQPIDGMVAIAGQLPTFEADQVRKALTAFGGGRPQPGDTRSPEQRMADGLLHLTSAGSLHPEWVDAANASDAGVGVAGASPTASLAGTPRGRQSARLIVTVPIDALARDGSAGGRTEFGHPIPGSIARTIAETTPPDQLATVLHDGNVVLAVGTTTMLDLERHARLGTRAQYVALLVRDGHCHWPGCSVPAAWCEIDHLQPWEHGGPTNLDNLWLLCSRHHSEKHRSGTECSAGRDGTNGPVTIGLPDGRSLASAPNGPITEVRRCTGARAPATSS